MNITRILFSPTGGTGQVADTITKEWGMPESEIDLTDPKTGDVTLHLQKEDLALLAVPSYGGRVPALAARRISKIHGNQARCVIVCVYGNRAYDDTLLELRDIAVKCGFRVIAAVAAVAEHSIVRRYGTGRPDAKDQQDLQNFARKILEKIENDPSEPAALQIPGNTPYRKAGAAGLVPEADSRCVNCGLCAEICPAQAINRDNIKTADSRKCISCMRCVAKCPQSARMADSARISAIAQALEKVCSTRKENELYL